MDSLVVSGHNGGKPPKYSNKRIPSPTFEVAKSPESFHSRLFGGSRKPLSGKDDNVFPVNARYMHSGDSGDSESLLAPLTSRSARSSRKGHDRAAEKLRSLQRQEQRENKPRLQSAPRHRRSSLPDNGQEGRKEKELALPRLPTQRQSPARARASSAGDTPLKARRERVIHSAYMRMRRHSAFDINNAPPRGVRTHLCPCAACLDLLTK